MSRIKICGITNLEDALMAIEAGADALGFIFAESIRNINIENASYILRSIPPFISCVGVFANQPGSFIKEVLKNCPLDTLQFHGEEPSAEIAQFRPHKRVIKTIRIKDAESLRQFNQYQHVDAFCLDTYSQEHYGGTGKTFEWSLLADAELPSKPLILAGGLNHDNVEEAILKVNPFAVDVCSSVEEAPGKKSRTLVESFIKKVKSIKGDSFAE